jgi:membrane-bound serine protease (ClpP class)
MTALVLGFPEIVGLKAQGPTILQIELADIIHPVSAEYVSEGLLEAAQNGAVAVIIRMDTPGGLVDSMREIVEAILASELPVIVWVGPSGVRAASAGFFILLAGDLALMAPGTNTGAAHPVSSLGGEIDEVMEEKIVNDASAFLRSYATRRGRNPELAETAVTESKAFTAEEALENNLIDGVVNDITDLIETYDGAEVVRFDGSTETLELAGATVSLYEMTSRQQLLSAIMNPNIALVLGLLGMVGLYLEITSPGMIFPGVIGGISLILALFAFNLLPVNLTGVLLILLSIGLFVVEATVPSHGVLAIGGVVAMIVGGLMLVEGPIPQLRVQLPTLLAVTLPLAVITVFLVRLVFVSHRTKATTGRSGMVSEFGTASTAVFDQGKVMVHGEYWAAHSNQAIPQGARVRVVQINGLNLEVESETEE